MQNRRTNAARLVSTALVLLGLATLGPAPIMGQKLGLKPHTNLQPQDEKALESQQHPMQIGQIGDVSDGKRNTPISTENGDQDAGAVMAAAKRNTTEEATSVNSQQVLEAASKRLEEPTGHSWVWAVLLVGGVLGGVFGVKRWADTNIPGPATTSTPKRDAW